MRPFECKDCKESFPTAEFFVYHIDTCKPKKNIDLTLKELIEIKNYLEAFSIPGERKLHKLIKRLNEVLS
jgi:hypothetical protein